MKKSEEKKNCDRYRILIQEELDGVLDSAERGSLSSHLEGCLSCRREKERMREIFRSLDNMRRVDVPVDFNKKVMAGMESRAAVPFLPSSFGWKHVTAVAAIAACFVLIIILSVFSLIPGMGESPLLQGCWQEGGKMGGLEVGKIIFSLFGKMAVMVEHLFQSLGYSMLSMAWYIVALIIGLFVLVNVLLKRTLRALPSEREKVDRSWD